MALGERTLIYNELPRFWCRKLRPQRAVTAVQIWILIWGCGRYFHDSGGVQQLLGEKSLQLLIEDIRVHKAYWGRALLPFPWVCKAIQK
jgi:hypothetical protein